MALIRRDNWQSGRTLCQSANFMLANKIGTNVTFKFPNTTTTVEAHRFVLMARSYVFYVMFDSILDKPGEAIEISGIDPAIFKEFLLFLYSDEITLSAESALHLTYCAEKYEVTDLKEKCTNFLQTHVDKTTVTMVLNHAVLYNEESLISTCRDIIEPLESLSCLEGHQMTEDTVELVLGFQGLVVGEVDIFKFCNTWAEQECTFRQVPVNASNRRKMLGPLLKKIPFCSMTHEEFATEVSGKHLLNGQEELQIFRYLCAPDKSNPPFPCKTKMSIEETLQLPCKSKKTWNLTNWKLKPNHIRHIGVSYGRHTGSLNCVTVSPDGSTLTTSGKDGPAMMWDLRENKHLTDLDLDDGTNALCFHPTRNWLCVATGPSIKILELENKVVIDELNASRYKGELPPCICLTWSADGQTLFAGYTNNTIRQWQMRDGSYRPLKTTHLSTSGYLNCMTISTVSVNGSICASCSQDGKVKLWDVIDGKHLRTVDDIDHPNALCFHPIRLWLCAATGPSITIWDLKYRVVLDELKREIISSSSNTEPPQCTCLVWSADGKTLFAGYTDNLLRQWQLSMAT